MKQVFRVFLGCTLACFSALAPLEYAVSEVTEPAG